MKKKLHNLKKILCYMTVFILLLYTIYYMFNAKIVNAKESLVLTISDISVPDHIYNGTGNIKLEGGILHGIEEGDDVSFLLNLALSETHNVGSDIPIQTDIELIGPDSPKYILIQPENLKVNIIPKIISIEDVFVKDRYYDGTSIVELIGGVLKGVESDDKVEFSLNQGLISDKNVGVNKDVLTNIVLYGEDSYNYILEQPDYLKVNILKKILTISNVLTINREYDGTIFVDLTGGSLNGLIEGDLVFPNLNQGIMNDKIVGENKPVATNINLCGDDSNNYTLEQPNDLKVNILKKNLTISNVETTNREYDGTIFINLTGGTLNGIIVGDLVFPNLNQGIMNDKTAGENKSVTTSIDLIGVDSNNYTLEQPENLLVNISRKIVSISDIYAVNRTYDGSTYVELTGGKLNDIVLDDIVFFEYDIAKISDKNVGKEKIVKTNINIIGFDSINYSLIQPVLYVDINPKNIVIENVFAVNRVINDGNIITLVGGNLKGIVENDIVRFELNNGLIDSPNKGNYNVSTSITIYGKDSHNYKLEQPTNIMVEIYANDKDLIFTVLLFVLISVILWVVIYFLYSLYHKKKNTQYVLNYDLNITNLNNELNNKNNKLKDLENTIKDISNKLRDSENKIDAFPVIKNAILPFIEKLLLLMHKAEDANQDDNFYMEFFRNILHQFTVQTLNINGIDVVISEWEYKDTIISLQNVEVVPKYTDDAEKNGKLFRTLKPGIKINGHYMIHEKIEVWEYNG